MEIENKRPRLPLNDFELYVYEKFTHIRPSHKDDEYRHGTVWFDSGVQHFQVCGDGYESERQADWMRRQLSKALANMALEVVEQILIRQKPSTDSKH